MTLQRVAAPGYVLPSITESPPRHLTLVQFIQTVLTGVSGLLGENVRPAYQVNPPKQPPIGIDWLAFRIKAINPDANSWVGVRSNGTTDAQRQEGLEISCTIYGNNALETADLIRDSFQIQQNREALTRANMGFTEATQAIQVPELLNEQWVDKYEMSVYLRRQVQRTYLIPTLISAGGRIHTVLGNEEYLLDWSTQS